MPHRLRSSDPQRARVFPVDTASVIAVGDMVWQLADDIREATIFPFVTADLARTQANFRRDFKGIAMNASAAGETDPIAVATLGTFEMDCVAAQFEVGDRIGPNDNSGGTALMPGEVIALNENDYGEIGTVVRRYGANTTRVLVEINPFGQLASQPLFITVFDGSTTTSGELVTDMAFAFPFQLVAINAIVTTVYVGTDVLTIDNGATALDDTVSLTGAAGVHIRTVMDDASGDDIFGADDTLTIATSGASTSGAAMIILEIIPFLHHN